MKKEQIISSLLLTLIAVIVVCLTQWANEEPGKVSPPEEAAVQISATYQSPVDFAKLQKQNPDIYCWLTVPGTEIDYPVLQNAEDDNLYMYHNADRQEDKNGALFTEHEYNTKTFTDPVTIIYGHHMKSGAMFGSLQQVYADEFEAHRDVVVYTPEAELHYRVFAAVPYGNRHILYYYDQFRTLETMREFAEEILDTRAIGATVDESLTVEEGDRFLVLSTCLQGNNTKRFLVIGKLMTE